VHARVVERRREEERPWRRWYREPTWRRLREVVLAEEPLCVLCKVEGRTEPSTCVDHVVPFNGNWDLFVRRDNLRGLCATCNSKKANTTDRDDPTPPGRGPDRPRFTLA
jgi:5-methylcytosine-specific restriction protein A